MWSMTGRISGDRVTFTFVFTHPQLGYMTIEHSGNLEGAFIRGTLSGVA
jgi:hypothetical protein